MLFFVVNCCLKPGSDDNTPTGKQTADNGDKHSDRETGIEVLDLGRVTAGDRDGDTSHPRMLAMKAGPGNGIMTPGDTCQELPGVHYGENPARKR